LANPVNLIVPEIKVLLISYGYYNFRYTISDLQVPSMKAVQDFDVVITCHKEALSWTAPTSPLTFQVPQGNPAQQFATPTYQIVPAEPKCWNFDFSVVETTSGTTMAA